MSREESKLPISTRDFSFNTVWGLIANVLFGVGRLAVLVVIAHFYGSLQVGWFVLAWAIVTPLSYLLNMEMRMVLVTDTTGQVQVGHCLSTRLLGSVVLLACLMLICIARRGVWDTDKCVIVMLVGILRAVECCADIYLAVLQKHEQMKRIAISHALKISLLAVVVALTLWSGRSMQWILIAQMAVIVVIGVIYDRRQAGAVGDVRWRWHWSATVRLVTWSLPLGVFLAIVGLNDAVGRYFLSHYVGDCAVGHFGILMVVLTAMAMAQAGINQAVLPRFARYFQQDVGAFVKLLCKLLALCWSGSLALMLAAWLIGRQIMAFALPQEYLQYSPLLVVVVLGGLILLTAMIIGDAVVACHRFMSRAVIVGAGLFFNTLICWLSISAGYGVAGAVWAMVCSALVSAVVGGVVLIMVLRDRIK